MTQEQAKYYKAGCDAMQARIAAWLMMKNQFELAPQVLGMKHPEYQEPERMILTQENKNIKEDQK